VVLADAARFKVLAAGRRWGKSIGVGIVAALDGHGPGRCFRGALNGGQVWWVVPEYPLTGRSRWRQLKRATRHVWVDKNEVERRVEFPGGGSITLKSADDPDSLRGEGLDGVVVDEASLMSERAWTEALRPALSDRQGWALFLFTPKGRKNWTWKLLLRGLTPTEAADAGASGEELGMAMEGWRAWRRPSSDNPQLTPDELAAARLELGSLLYAQEYEAAFVLLVGKIFNAEWLRYYDRLADGTLVLEGDVRQRIGPEVLAGMRRLQTVDLALSTKTHADYTVVLTCAVTPRGQLVVLDLYRARLEAPDIVPALRAQYLLHRPAYIGVEATAYQAAIVQGARRDGLPVRSITPDKDKVTRALKVAAMAEGGQLYLPRAAPWLTELLAEVLAFDEGDHDDQVDTLAYMAHEVAGGPDNTLRSA
jgi:predicted phage terminase large subunit-like protein